MLKRTGRTAAELCGAVIGAGFASGREIAAFFSRFGAWSWLGVAAAGVVIGCMCLGLMRRPGMAGMPQAWRGRWLEWIWRGLFTALLTAAGGAMLAGTGEIMALLAPVYGARWIGMTCSMLLAWQLTGRESRMLAGVSRGLILCLLAVMLAGLVLPPRQAVSVAAGGGAEGILMGLCYGGFNVALAAPVVAETGKRLKGREQTRCVITVTALLTLLLACANGVLLRHAALQDELLPFVMLLAPWGRWGFVLAGAALYLAALTTLAACLQGLKALVSRWMPAAVAAVALLSLGGLEGIVNVVYPVLGGGCFLLLAASRMQIGTKT